MPLLKISSGHKNQELLNKAFIYAKIQTVLQSIFQTHFPEFIQDYNKISLEIKNNPQILQLKIKSNDIQFLTWLKSHNIQELVQLELEKAEILGDQQILKLIYKII